MTTRRQVVKMALEFQRPPYVPWSFGFTEEAADKLRSHYGTSDLDAVLGNHLLWLGNAAGTVTTVGPGRVRDAFGVVWNRSVDHDIGVVEELQLPEPDLRMLQLPDPDAPVFFEAMHRRIASNIDGFRVFPIGFSLYERAWTLRGMENLLLDFVENSDFVDGLMGAIADFNIAQARRAMEADIDAVYFGDDWGQQHGLQMGYDLWKRFLYPHLRRQYAAVHETGRKVFIHSCGDVDELFDDLIDIGVNCFNPFQPEVMDVPALMQHYRGRLAFHGGLSTQRTLPYGTPDDVRTETRRLLDLGRNGGYILAPAHAVEGDVPLENMLAFIEVAHEQTHAMLA